MNITAAQQNVLTGGGVVALLSELVTDGGSLRLSTLTFDWDDANGDTWFGSKGVVDHGPSHTGEGSIEVKWSGASTDLLSAARDADLAGATFIRKIAFISNAMIQVDDLITEFEGVCQVPDITMDLEAPTITMRVESDVVTTRRENTFRYTKERVRSENAADTFCDLTAGLAEKDIFD